MVQSQVDTKGNNMTESALATPQSTRRIDLKRIFAFLRHPSIEYGRMAEDQKPTWLTPMLTLSITLLLNVITSGAIQAKAAMMNGITLPPDAQWWTPEMQQNYMTAMQQTQGPVFLYIMPAILGLASLWLGWGILSGLFHLSSTLFGGRGSMNSALNVVAWASLPFALRDLLRVVFVLIVQNPIQSPGLSGFVVGSESGLQFVAQLLKMVDIFFIWHAILAIIGFNVSDNLPTAKAVAGVLIVLLLSMLAQAGMGMMNANLAGLLVTRPF